MRCPSPEPVRRRHPPLPIGPVALVGLAALTVAGCSSPSRGPETDIVEVERIEIVPTEADASPPASAPVVEAAETVDAANGGAATGGRATVGGPATPRSDDASRSAAEEVPAAPAAD